MKGKSNETAFSNAPHVCKGCYRWEQWKHNCTYFWNEKKECGSKVKDYEDMVNLDQVRRR